MMRALRRSSSSSVFIGAFLLRQRGRVEVEPGCRVCRATTQPSRLTPHACAPIVWLPFPPGGIMPRRSTLSYSTSPLRFAAIAALLLAPAATQAQVQAGKPTALSAELLSAKAALAKYADPIVAVRDGYFSTVACVDVPNGAVDGPVTYPPGAMGVHFLNVA